MTAQDVMARALLCLLGLGMLIAGLVGTVKQGWWKQ
jgi:hypothetical protein